MVRPPSRSVVSSAITFSAIPTSSSVPLIVSSPSRATNRTWRCSSTIRICSSFRPKRAWMSPPEGRGTCLRTVARSPFISPRTTSPPESNEGTALGRPRSLKCYSRRSALSTEKTPCFSRNFKGLDHMESEAEFLKLHGVHRRRGTRHEALGPLRLREGDHLADRVGPRQQHDEAVEPEGDSPMGGGAKFEGLQEEPEPLPRLLRAEPEGIEHLLLSLPVVVSDAAATQLVAIDHEVVRLGPHRLGGALEQREILVHGGGEGGGDRYEPLFLLAILQEGKIGDPDRTDKGLVYQAQLDPQLHPQAAEGLRHHGRVVADREDKVARHKLETPDQPFEGLRTKELGHRRLKPLCGHPKGGEALRPETLHELGEVIDHFSGERLGLPLHPDALDLAPAGEGVREGAKGGAPEQVAHLHEEHLESNIRLIKTVPRHRLVIPQAREGPVKLDTPHLTQDGRDHLLRHGHDVLPVYERHLDVDLGELRLPVGPQVFVPKALHDLEIAIEAGHHQELLEDLGRLGQREEVPGVEPGGHQVVPRALGRAPGERRGLYLVQAMPVEEGPDYLGGLMAG